MWFDPLLELLEEVDPTLPVLGTNVLVFAPPGQFTIMVAHPDRRLWNNHPWHSGWGRWTDGFFYHCFQVPPELASGLCYHSPSEIARILRASLSS